MYTIYTHTDLTNTSVKKKNIYIFDILKRFLLWYYNGSYSSCQVSNTTQKSDMEITVHIGLGGTWRSPGTKKPNQSMDEGPP